MEACGTCRFFVDGDCRRLPPSAAAVWPRVDRRDWCGEWRPEDGRRDRVTTGARLAYQGLYLWRSTPSWLSNVVFRAALLMLTIGYVVEYVPRPNPQQVILGLVIYAAPTVLLPGVGQEFTNDRLFGTLTVALATDVSKLRLWAEKALYQVPNAIYSVAVAFAVGWAFFDVEVPWAAVPWALAALVAALAGAVALALLAGSVSLVYRDWAVPATVFGGIIFLLGGVVISRRALPLALERASYFVPTANALEAFRRALSEQSWTQVAPLLLAELAVAGLTLAIGYVVFSRFVERARREGLLTLDQTL